MKGYRINELFGLESERTLDPREVVYYEVYFLRKTDILEYILSHENHLDEEEKGYFQEIINEEHDEIDKDYLKDILNKHLGKYNNCCLWLCDSPDDLSVYTDSKFVQYSNNKSMQISEYILPDNFMILSDIGVQGKLYCFNREEFETINGKLCDWEFYHNAEEEFELD